MSKKYKVNIVPVEYLNTTDKGIYTVIETEKGLLVTLRIADEEKQSIKSDGWHLLTEEYYTKPIVDVLILRVYCEPRIIRYKTFYDLTIDQETKWWHYRCGELVPPFEWDGYKQTKAMDYVVAWKPHKGETVWKGIDV